ncbi:hypothetical protein PVAND_017716 [Polypedilum vanderplanki]|uniref:DUF4806 domain-containing protein n=1 Tax=Polypedilum vanderplanki TaxID=319348 RepID=A0A9J6B8P0_POLVA|nr:hypothetical protein PVAND_017716 [Polypedilum vanderplanki]
MSKCLFSVRFLIVYDITIKKKFAKKSDADSYCKTISDVGTSSDENDNQNEREMKRRFPISNQIDEFDLNYKLIKLENQEKEKIKIAAESAHDKAADYLSDTITVEAQEQIEEGMVESHHVLNSTPIETMISNTQYSSIVVLINSLHQKIDNLTKEVNDLKRKLGHRSEENLQIQHYGIISTKDDLEELGNKMKDTEFKKQMIFNLKFVGSAPGYHNPNHGRVAAILNKMLDSNFLKICSWSKQPGKTDPNKIYLVNYPIITELISEAMSENKDGATKIPDPKLIRESIQNYFKRNKTKSGTSSDLL